MPSSHFKYIKTIITSAIIFSTTTAAQANANDLANGVLLGDLSKLDANVPPAKNFELIDWTLSIPVDQNKDGKAENIPESLLAKELNIPPLFYTGSDGAMVFLAPNHGPKTSKNTKYTRTELREMLRRGNTRIKTKGITKNNWVFGSARKKVRKNAGGVNGTLDATLAVNHVSTTGDPKKVGRVIVGQIHATDDEPVRIYYRKLPNNTKGSIYMAHEPLDGKDIYFEFVGSKASNAKDPIEDGVALNELFSYRINVEDDTLTVTLIRQGKDNITHVVDMSESGYSKSSQYMYFKAGVYNQNNTGDENDYVKASFYHLENSHEGYKY